MTSERKSTLDETLQSKAAQTYTIYINSVTFRRGSKDATKLLHTSSFTSLEVHCDFLGLDHLAASVSSCVARKSDFLQV
jgi:hypothetical protein